MGLNPGEGGKNNKTNYIMSCEGVKDTCTFLTLNLIMSCDGGEETKETETILEGELFVAIEYPGKKGYALMIYKQPIYTEKT